MPRLSLDKNPKLRRHRASGQGVVTHNGHYLMVWPSVAKKLRAPCGGPTGGGPWSERPTEAEGAPLLL